MIDLDVPIILADPINRAHPLNHGRKAWWLVLPGLDGGRAWFDLIGANHAVRVSGGGATPSDGPTWAGTSRPGGYGQLSFDATDDWARVTPATEFRPTAAVTMAAWVRPNSLSSDRYICNYIPEVASLGLALSFSGGALGMVMSGGPSNLNTGSQPLTVGKWSRIVGTYDGATQNLYVDSVRVATQSASGAITTPSGVTSLGCRSQFGENGWDGAIDDISISDRAWSAVEVTEDFALSRRGYPGVLARARSSPLFSAAVVAGSPYVVPTYPGIPAALLAM